MERHTPCLLSNTLRSLKSFWAVCSTKRLRPEQKKRRVVKDHRGEEKRENKRRLRRWSLLGERKVAFSNISSVSS